MPTRKSFYGLPPPWNPGYAIPKAVMEEGLQRHAYTTAWMARGTYDRATDGTAGYQVPQYVMEERTGRGAFTTAWAPRGSKPNVPHYLNRHPVPNIEALSGIEAALGSLGDIVDRLLLPITPTPPTPPKQIAAYGQRTAQGVLARVARMAPQHRTAVLNQALDRIDPRLRARTESYTKHAIARGMTPRAALQHGMAQAMSQGITEELAKLGKSRAMPHPSSLLGMGLNRARTRTQGAVGSYVGLGGITGSQLAPAVAAQVPINVGPFTLPSAADIEVRGNWAVPFTSPADLAKLPEAQKQYIRNALIHGAGDDGPWRPFNFSTAMKGVMGPDTWARAACPWIQALGLNCNQKLAREMIYCTLTPSYDSIANKAVAPIATFTMPASGSIINPTTGQPVIFNVTLDWGIFLAFMNEPSDEGCVNSPTKFYLLFKRIPTAGWIHKLGRFIKHIPAEIGKGTGAVVNGVKDVANFVGDQACSLLHQPGAIQGAAAANPAAGVGAAIAAGLCSAPPPPPPPPPPDDGLMKTLLIGGIALAGIAILTKKKKTEP